MILKPQQQRKLAQLLLFLVIFWAGRLSIQYERARQLPPVQAHGEINPGVPMVHIEKIENAQIIGTVSQPEMRIASEQQVAIPQEDLSFTLNIEHLGYIGPKRQVIDHHIPESARFVASKKGKYFYALDEKQAKRLSVPNRVYFETEGEAREAGYLPRGE